MKSKDVYCVGGFVASVGLGISVSTVVVARNDLSHDTCLLVGVVSTIVEWVCFVLAERRLQLLLQWLDIPREALGRLGLEVGGDFTESSRRDLLVETSRRASSVSFNNSYWARREWAANFLTKDEPMDRIRSEFIFYHHMLCQWLLLLSCCAWTFVWVLDKGYRYPGCGCVLLAQLVACFRCFRAQARMFHLIHKSMKAPVPSPEEDAEDEQPSTTDHKRAALLLKDVVAGRATNIWLLRTANARSIWLFFFRRNVWRPVVLLSCFGLVVLAIKPHLGLEVLCLLVLVVDMLIEGTYLSSAPAFRQIPHMVMRYFSKYHRGYNQRRVFALIVSVLCFSLLLRAGSTMGSTISPWSRRLPKVFSPVAPLLIITQFVSLRRLIKLLLFTLIKSKDILFFLACVLLLTSIVGVLALADCSFGQSESTSSVSFHRVSVALISSFVLTGSDNLSPFIENPCGKMSWAYFVIFTIFVQMLILNMLMVSFYDAYKQFLVSTIEKTWREELEALSTVFLLSSSYTVDATQEVCMSFDDWKSLNFEYDPQKPRDVLMDQFKEVSRNQGHIEVGDFVSVLDLLLLSFKKERIKPRSRLSHMLLMTYKTRGLNGGTMGSGKRLQWRPAPQLAVHAFVALHIGFSCTIHGSGDVGTDYPQGVGLAFLSFHVLEQLAKACLTNNMGLFFKNNKLDGTILCIAVLLVIPCAFVSEQKWGARIGCTFPILRLLTVFPNLKRILLDVFRIVIPLTSFLTLLFLSFLFFGLLGHALFEDDENFSSFGKAVLTLFLLFQQESTKDIIDSVLAGGRFYWIWYFVCYQFVTVWLISNTFVGIVFHHFQHRHQLEEDGFDDEMSAVDGGENRVSGCSDGGDFVSAGISNDRLSGMSVGSELELDMSPTELVLAEKLSAGLISQGEYDQLVEQARMANAFTMDLNEQERVNVFRAKLKAGVISEQEYQQLVKADKGAFEIMAPDHFEDRSSEYGGGKKHTRLRKKRTMRATARNMEKQLLKMEKQLLSTREVERQLLSSQHRNVDLSSKRSLLAKTARASVRRPSRPLPATDTGEGRRRQSINLNPMLTTARLGSMAEQKEVELTGL
jgi:hypothetical protein